MSEIKRVGNMVQLLTRSNSDSWKPKKMIFTLSECGKYYNTLFYIDLKQGDKTYEGYIECKTNIPEACDFVNSFTILPEDDENSTIFTITIPDEES